MLPWKKGLAHKPIIAGFCYFTIWQSESSEEIFVSTSLSQVVKWTRFFFVYGAAREHQVFSNLGKHLHR